MKQLLNRLMSVNGLIDMIWKRKSNLMHLMNVVSYFGQNDSFWNCLFCTIFNCWFPFFSSTSVSYAVFLSICVFFVSVIYLEYSLDSICVNAIQILLIQPKKRLDLTLTFFETDAFKLKENDDDFDATECTFYEWLP